MQESENFSILISRDVARLSLVCALMGTWGPGLVHLMLCSKTLSYPVDYNLAESL